MQILLHNEDEFPDVVERGFIVGTGYENYVALNSYSVSYTDAIPAVPFEKRQCYVEGEGSLKYNFTGLSYTRSSCIFECRAHKILEECQCLPYFIKGDDAKMLIGMNMSSLNAGYFFSEHHSPKLPTSVLSLRYQILWLLIAPIFMSDDSKLI